MKSRPKNKLFRTWLLIQFCFFIFMAAVTAGIYFYTNYHIKNQMDELYISDLERTEAEVDALFESVVATAHEYVMHPRVRALAGADLNASERDLARLVNDIKQTNSAAKGVLEIVIYFSRENVFISSAGVMDDDIFNKVYAPPEDGAADNAMMSVITDEAQAGRVVPVYNGRNDTDTAVFTEKAADDIFVSAIVDHARIEDILNANLQDDNNAYCVFAGDALLCAAGSELSEAFCIKAGAYENTLFLKVEDIDQKYVYLSAQKDNIKCVYLINDGNYMAGQFRIQRIAIIILAVSIVLGAGASYYITRFKYKPVEKVVNISKAITPGHVFASSENELEQIKDAIEFIYDQKEKAKTVLETHNVFIRDNAIKMLLDGDIRYQDMTEHIKSLINITSNAFYTVAVMDIAYKEAERLKESLPDTKYIVFKGGRAVIIFKARAKDVLSRMGGWRSAEGFGVIAVGADGTGPDGIKRSYEHALLGLSRKILPDAPKVIPPLSNRETRAMTISTDAEIRLGGYIQSGDADSALAMLEELAREHDVNKLDLFSFKAYLFNISNVIIRSAEDVLSDDVIAELLDKLGASFQGEDYQRISRALEDAVVYICREYREKKSSSNKHLNANVILYIESRISDAQLSSDMIAVAMNLNSAYLRRFFKEQNGITLWDFINMKRIETAKNLLITTHSSIKNIALSCGYISISTFVRTFKKFSGMTPGHYRDLYR